uniref:sodium/calcium exchanger NCL2-like n=1 Tax=Erigeron canadensis TaxID=72917 RepID=UPI001CB91C13|nr:sodium/calcium exchanger NCL2-like [Erigeron canadensis]
MKVHVKKNNGFIILLAILIGFCVKTEGSTTVTCEPQYGFLPCTSDIWGRLFLIVVYQYVLSLAQTYVSKGSDKFFGLIGPGIFGASLFHILANFPSLYLVLQSGLSTDEEGASSNTEMGMNILTGSAVMNLTLIWPLVITFGSYNLADDEEEDSVSQQQLPAEDEPSFLQKLTAYGVATDNETSYTARIMLVAVIPFFLLQLPAILNSTSVTRVILLVTLIIVVSLFFAYMTYQMFQPWIQNRGFEYATQRFVKSKLEALLSTNGKPNVRLIKEIYEGLDKNNDGKVSNAELKNLILGIQLQEEGVISDTVVDKVFDQLDISGDEIIQESEFIRIMMKWLRDARRSTSQNNDYNPISFFLKRNVGADDEEGQTPLIPKDSPNTTPSSILEFLEALCLVVFGTGATMLISSQLTTHVWTFASQANVPSFLIPYFIIPCFSNRSRMLSTIQSARQKTERAASLTLSQIYSGVAMGSLSSLSTFLAIVYIKDLSWNVSAQVLVMLIICGVMTVITSTRTVYPLWMGYMIYLMYPTSLLMLYLLTVVWGW